VAEGFGEMGVADLIERIEIWRRKRNAEKKENLGGCVVEAMMSDERVGNGNKEGNEGFCRKKER